MSLTTNRAHRPQSRILARICVCAALLLAAAGSRWSFAATFCVTAGDMSGLQSALATAAGNGEDDLIELQGGQYPMPASFLLEYNAITEHHDVTIEGGYGANIGDPCGTPPTFPDPRVTVLDGGLWRAHLAVGVGSFTMRAVTVQNTFDIDPNHAPVEITAAPNSTGNITLENAIFSGNGSTTKPAIYLFSDQGAVLIQNALFDFNVSFSGQSAVRIGSLRAGGSICTSIVNATFTANTTSTAGIDVSTQMCFALAANDIFWGNGAGGDVQFDNPSNTYVEYSDLGDLAEAQNTQSSNLLSVDPLFLPDYSLHDLSPLRDKGSSGGFVFSPGSFDVVGNPRTYGTNPDIGAFEVQDVIFADGFDW
jgi:hypothetical protein